MTVEKSCHKYREKEPSCKKLPEQEEEDFNWKHLKVT